MSPRKLLIAGAGGLGNEYTWVAEEMNHSARQRGKTTAVLEILGYTDDDPAKKEWLIGGYVVHGKQFFCLESMGNISGASTPVALAEAWRQRRIRPGSRTLMCSFGAGLTWGVAVIKWPENANPVPDLDPVVSDEEMLSAAL